MKMIWEKPLDVINNLTPNINILILKRKKKIFFIKSIQLINNSTIMVLILNKKTNII